MSSGQDEEETSVIQGVTYAIADLLEIEGYETLLPQVGSNLVYAKLGATKIEDVAALSGRMIKTIDGPISCGEVIFGASQYLSTVVLAALKIDTGVRAAMNVCANEALTKKLEEIGLRVEIVPQKTVSGECPVSLFIRESGGLVDAYVHMGDFGVEPTTTILSQSPEGLVRMIRKLSRYG